MWSVGGDALRFGIFGFIVSFISLLLAGVFGIVRNFHTHIRRGKHL